ncbi:NnrU family protein [Pseudomaricurvus alkylphenolicus]|jgi:uncharacterized membrane protein|uniref:NnrU family protein n=1 Tax=Pseudomaricurvus alkylphenolicus TaxID=1306991 RepID=UPI00142090E4|nr:NnrU family protein [Pseudomaricurvus alkylphenolicus]NIB41570.1 NnrU family protein [Pseudomaricurvus alkylphenolicus]
MTLLILGTLIFFGIHFVPSTPLRTKMVESLGLAKYKILFSLASVVGLGLIIYGFGQASYIHLWSPLPWGKTLTMVTMPIAILLLVAADMPNNIKRWVRHPMLIGLFLWGGTHLLANGDLASTILFLSFAIFAVLDLMLVTMSGRGKQKKPVNVGWDVAVVVVGLSVYGLLFYFHGTITGVPLI